MTENYRISAVMLLMFVLSYYSYAFQDANITVYDDHGLCVAFDDSQCQTCDNQTISLDGTKDHLMKIVPERLYGNCHNYSLQNVRQYGDDIGETISSGEYLDWVMVVILISIIVFIIWLIK
jgi:hypothetical protein